MYLSITHNKKKVLAIVILATCFGSKMKPKGRQKKVHKGLVERE